jgi:hypothetical protein
MTACKELRDRLRSQQDRDRSSLAQLVHETPLRYPRLTPAFGLNHGTMAA